MKLNIPDIRQRLSNNTVIDAKEIQALCDEAEANQWISVDDRLPENQSGVIVCYIDKWGKQRVTEAHFVDSMFGFGSAWDEVNTLEYLMELTHWKQLPKPPTD